MATPNVDSVFAAKESIIVARAQQICAETENAKISPTTIILLIEIAVKLIEWWRNRNVDDESSDDKSKG